MALPTLNLSLQFGDIPSEARHRAALPRHKVMRWIRHSLAHDGEITVRIVDAEEGQRLNREFRKKDYATNVLTFDYMLSPVTACNQMSTHWWRNLSCEIHGSSAGLLRHRQCVR